MTDHADAPLTQDPLDGLIQRVLEFNHVVTDMIGRMIEFEASGRSTPDAPPIPDVLRGLLRDAVAGVEDARSAGELRLASSILEDMLDAISDELFAVAPEMLEALDDLDGFDGEAGGWPGTDPDL